MSNSLASVHPELISEWSEKNLPLTPDKITSVQIKECGGKVLADTSGKRASKLAQRARNARYAQERE